MHSTAAKNGPLRLAIIGSGPAGFYSAHRFMTRVEHGVVDMYEQLPVPFGLVRFGVAPDHPEVKNCQDKFKEIAESTRFNFVGNVNVGHDVSLAALNENYDAILFAYGASKDKQLGISGENLNGIYSARAFVGWYNGLPEYADLSPNLKTGDTAVVVGQGNVALDVARVLLSGPDRLRNSDITDQALETLSTSTIKNVRIIGRRGPLQASFTIKEVRELMQVPQVEFESIDTTMFPGPEVKLPRAQKRITDLFKKHAAMHSGQKLESSDNLGTMHMDFMLAPESFTSDGNQAGNMGGLRLTRTAFGHGQDAFDPAASVTKTHESLSIKASTAFRSIGYKAEPLPGMEELGIVFNETKGTIPNLGGRVLQGDEHLPGLYCAGWVKRGPTGVIATTMEDGFATAELMAQDLHGKGSNKQGWDALKSHLPHATNWQDWLKIDAVEMERGKASRKEREKIRSITEMLAIVH